jgi:8-oxo-dGTP pyrophosphatase MutT (NUDIX family)
MAKGSDNKAKRSTAVSAPGQPPRLQVAALCWRRTGKGIRVLLITSRDTGRWVIPKGWPMRHRTEAETAAREAFEEAGLRGDILERSIGVYTYRKVLAPGRTIPCVVRVYPLEVRELLKQYPETGQRRVKWFTPDKAARRVLEPDLRALIRDFQPAPPDSGSGGPGDRH